MSIFLALLLFGPRSLRATNMHLTVALLGWYLCLQCSLAVISFSAYRVMTHMYPLAGSLLMPTVVLVYQYVGVELADFIFLQMGDSAPIETLVMLISLCMQTGEAAKMMSFLSASLKTEDMLSEAMLMSLMCVVSDIFERLNFRNVLQEAYLCGRRYHLRFAWDIAYCARFKMKLFPIGTLVALAYAVMREPAVLRWEFWIFLLLYAGVETLSDTLLLICQRVLWRSHGGKVETLMESIQRVQRPLGLRFPRVKEGLVDDKADLTLPEVGALLNGLGSISPATMSATFSIVVAVASVNTVMVGSVIEPARIRNISHW